MYQQTFTLLETRKLIALHKYMYWILHTVGVLTHCQV